MRTACSQNLNMRAVLRLALLMALLCGYNALGPPGGTCTFNGVSTGPWSPQYYRVDKSCATTALGVGAASPTERAWLLTASLLRGGTIQWTGCTYLWCNVPPGVGADGSQWSGGSSDDCNGRREPATGPGAFETGDALVFPPPH